MGRRSQPSQSPVNLVPILANPSPSRRTPEPNTPRKYPPVTFDPSSISRQISHTRSTSSPLRSRSKARAISRAAETGTMVALRDCDDRSGRARASTLDTGTLASETSGKEVKGVPQHVLQAFIPAPERREYDGEMSSGQTTSSHHSCSPPPTDAFYYEPLKDGQVEITPPQIRSFPAHPVVLKQKPSHSASSSVARRRQRPIALHLQTSNLTPMNRTPTTRLPCVDEQDGAKYPKDGKEARDRKGYACKPLPPLPQTFEGVSIKTGHDALTSQRTQEPTVENGATAAQPRSKVVNATQCMSHTTTNASTQPDIPLPPLITPKASPPRLASPITFLAPPLSHRRQVDVPTSPMSQINHDISVFTHVHGHRRQSRSDSDIILHFHSANNSPEMSGHLRERDRVYLPLRIAERRKRLDGSYNGRDTSRKPDAVRAEDAVNHGQPGHSNRDTMYTPDSMRFISAQAGVSSECGRIMVGHRESDGRDADLAKPSRPDHVDSLNNEQIAEETPSRTRSTRTETPSTTQSLHPASLNGETTRYRDAIMGERERPGSQVSRSAGGKESRKFESIPIPWSLKPIHYSEVDVRNDDTIAAPSLTSLVDGAQPGASTHTLSSPSAPPDGLVMLLGNDTLEAIYLEHLRLSTELHRLKEKHAKVVEYRQGLMSDLAGLMGIKWGRDDDHRDGDSQGTSAKPGESRILSGSASEGRRSEDGTNSLTNAPGSTAVHLDVNARKEQLAAMKRIKVDRCPKRLLEKIDVAARRSDRLARQVFICNDQLRQMEVLRQGHEQGVMKAEMMRMRRELGSVGVRKDAAEGGLGCSTGCAGEVTANAWSGSIAGGESHGKVCDQDNTGVQGDSVEVAAENVDLICVDTITGKQESSHLADNPIVVEPRPSTCSRTDLSSPNSSSGQSEYPTTPVIIMSEATPPRPSAPASIRRDASHPDRPLGPRQLSPSHLDERLSSRLPESPGVQGPYLSTRAHIDVYHKSDSKSDDIFKLDDPRKRSHGRDVFRISNATSISSCALSPSRLGFPIPPFRYF